MSYAKPSAFLLDDPEGLDKELQKIQLKLQTQLGWLEIAFGRAFRQEGIMNTAKGEKKYYFPEVYQNNMEAFNVMPNDNVMSASFFYSRDPGKPVNYTVLSYNAYTYPVSLIFWVNLRLIDKTKDFRFTETLKIQALRVLASCATLKVTAVYEEWQNVLADFTLSGNTKQYLKPPYSGFRVDFDLSYTDIIKSC